MWKTLVQTALFFFWKKRLWNAKCDPKFGLRVVVLVTTVTGKKKFRNAVPASVLLRKNLRNRVLSQNAPAHNLHRLHTRRRMFTLSLSCFTVSLSHWPIRTTSHYHLCVALHRASFMITGSDLRISLSSLRRRGRRRGVETNAEYSVVFVAFKAGD
jgi:hypothetical protein